MRSGNYRLTGEEEHFEDLPDNPRRTLLVVTAVAAAAWALSALGVIPETGSEDHVDKPTTLIEETPTALETQHDK